MKAVVRNKQLVVYGLIIVAVILSFLFVQNSVPDAFYERQSGEAAIPVGEIVRENYVEQEYLYHVGDSGVSICFATYARDNTGDVTVHIEGEMSGYVYVDQIESAGAFADNSFRDIMYVGDLPQEDEMLKISITSSSQQGEAITAWCTTDDALPDCSLVVNGETKNNDIVIKAVISSPRKKITWLFFALSIAVLIAAFIAVSRKELNLERSYLSVALLLGIIYLFVMTPFSIPDELTHYRSTYRLSNVICFQWDEIEYGEPEYLDYHGLGIHSNVGTAYDRLANEFFSKKHDETNKIELGGGDLTYPVMLIPQAIGFTIGRVLNLNFLITFYLGRITNLLFYIGCVYLAIKKTPRFKLLFFLIGIMPMALHQAASYSYDTYINGMSVLLLAYLLQAIEGDGIIRPKETLTIAAIGALLAPAKIIYALLLLIVFLIPVRRFPNRKSYYISIGIILFSAAMMVLIFHLSEIMNVTAQSTSSLNWENGVNYSVADILNQPQKTWEIFKHTFETYGWGWYLGAIGLSLSGLTMVVDEWIIISFSTLLMLSSFKYETEKSTTGKERCIYLLVSAGVVFMAMLIMFLSWTSNTRDIILGVQGRYFIPVLPLIYMSMSNRLVETKKPIGKYIITSGVLLSIITMGQVFYTTLLQ